MYYASENIGAFFFQKPMPSFFFFLIIIPKREVKKCQPSTLSALIVMNLQHDLYSVKEQCFDTSIIHFLNVYFIVSKFIIF